MRSYRRDLNSAKSNGERGTREDESNERKNNTYQLRERERKDEKSV
jgi:hypothetical protein